MRTLVGYDAGVNRSDVRLSVCTRVCACVCMFFFRKRDQDIVCTFRISHTKRRRIRAIPRSSLTEGSSLSLFLSLSLSLSLSFFLSIIERRFTEERVDLSRLHARAAQARVCVTGRLASTFTRIYTLRVNLRDGLSLM